VVNVVTGYGPSTGAALTRHPLVRKIAFTGGAATARHVVRSSAENFAKLSLELGGKSPNIIFADADLDSAINGAVAGIYAASGQSCVAGSRLLVQDEIFDEFVERLMPAPSASASATRRTTPAKWARWPPRSNWPWSKAWWRGQGRRRQAAHGRQACRGRR
jgi:acyl-CoA reductase-like NAD-dependent aldehyde dehydrogenase